MLLAWRILTMYHCHNSVKRTATTVSHCDCHYVLMVFMCAHKFLIYIFFFFKTEGEQILRVNQSIILSLPGRSQAKRHKSYYCVLKSAQQRGKSLEGTLHWCACVWHSPMCSSLLPVCYIYSHKRAFLLRHVADEHRTKWGRWNRERGGDAAAIAPIRSLIKLFSMNCWCLG